jgi:hypothetical protein
MIGSAGSLRVDSIAQLVLEVDDQPFFQPMEWRAAFAPPPVLESAHKESKARGARRTANLDHARQANRINPIRKLEEPAVGPGAPFARPDFP